MEKLDDFTKDLFDIKTYITRMLIPDKHNYLKFLDKMKELLERNDIEFLIREGRDPAYPGIRIFDIFSTGVNSKEIYELIPKPRKGIMENLSFSHVVNSELILNIQIYARSNDITASLNDFTHLLVIQDNELAIVSPF